MSEETAIEYMERWAAHYRSENLKSGSLFEKVYLEGLSDGLELALERIRPERVQADMEARR